MVAAAGLASMAVPRRSVLRYRRYRSRRQVHPTTSAGSAERRAHHLQTGDSGTSWWWSPTRSSRAAFLRTRSPPAMPTSVNA